MAKKHDYKEWWKEAVDEKREIEDFLDDCKFTWIDALTAWKKANDRYDRIYDEFEKMSSKFFHDQINSSRKLKKATYKVTYDFDKNKVVLVEDL